MQNNFICSSNTITPLPLAMILSQVISVYILKVISVYILTVWCPHTHFNIILPTLLIKFFYKSLVNPIQDAKYVFHFNHKLTTLTATGRQYIMHKEPSYAISHIPAYFICITLPFSSEWCQSRGKATCPLFSV